MMKTFFYEIPPYQIQASGMRLTVLPMEDGVYRIVQGGKLVAVFTRKSLQPAFFGTALDSSLSGLRKKSGSRSMPMKSKSIINGKHF